MSQVQLSEKEKAIETLRALSPQEKTEVTLGFMNDLPTPQLQNVVETGVNNLPPQVKNQVAKNTGLGGPGQGVTNYIWVIVVTAFVVLLLGAAAFLTSGVIFLGKKADDVQVVITVFTAAITFLGGLFSPSPVGGSKQ